MKTNRHSRLAALLLGSAAACAILSAPALAADQASDIRHFDIPAQDAAMALNDYARQAGVQIVFPYDFVKGRQTPQVQGDLSREEALAMLTNGLGLKITSGPSGMIALRDAADPQSGSAAGDGAEGTVAALIVTAQKKEEQIQDVPIAISAFTEKSLEEQKIEGGFDLLKAIPNVTFSKNNFSGYNFSIRGIGTKAVSVTTDPGVAVSFNNTTLIRNRLFEQEYFDVERVEVLRGPQGTPYGRNATAGVVNMISAKPDLDKFEGMVKAEVGNYQTRRAVGMINIPLINDKLAIRIAGSATMRDGYNINLFDNKPVDGRNLWSGRVTIGFKPFERLHGNFVWEHFNEDDNRSRTGKQLCTHDSGPATVGGAPFPVDNPDDAFHTAILYRGLFSQGCLPGSLYDKAAYGTPNGLAIPFVMFMELDAIGLCPDQTQCHYQYAIKTNTDPYGNRTQSHNLRALYSQIDPVYRAKADVFELNFDFDISPSLTLTSETAYNKDNIYSSQDYNRYTTDPVIQDSSNLILEGGEPSPWRGITPGGMFCDPQLGCSDTIVGMDISRAKSQQFSQAFRLQSNFSGRLNFSGGIDYTRYQTVEDYYVFFNGITMASILVNSLLGVGGIDPSKYTSNPNCSATGGYFGNLLGRPDLPDGILCVPIEQNPLNAIKDTGHNYFLSRNPYRLQSKAAFGELYWQATDTVKVTAGLRYTDDQKTFTPIPSETLLSDPARANLTKDAIIAAFPSLAYLVPRLGGVVIGSLPGLYPAEPDVRNEWRELTGRFGVDWRPVVPFTDQSMVYAFYSRGYKGGGMNPPFIALDQRTLLAAGIFLTPSAPPNFRPEFVNAFELGSKNTLLGGSLVLNGDAFLYDYKDYQVSKIVDRSASNENFDATVWGLEFESVFQPTRNLRFNASLGYLHTQLANGSKSIDIMNRTAGDPNWIVIKPAVALTSNCIAPLAQAVKLMQDFGPYAASRLCPGGGGPAGGDTLTGKNGGGTFLDGSTYDPADHPEANYGAGIDTDVSGNALPNSPHYTVTLGGQYSRDFLANWRATVRADFYWQSQSWARIYELPIDKLHSWKNGNVSLLLEKPDNGLAIELYVKNVFNDTPITDTFLNSDDSALTTNIFVLDPRIVGLSIKKGF